MRKTISIYKLKKISIESFINGLRLHFDSIFLFNNNSYPASFQLSVLAMEEFSKSDWVEHYYWSSITNGFPDVDFEQEWLQLLYLHPKKQITFIWRTMHQEYSPKFVKLVEDKQLELKKQRATYVGLDKVKGIIDVNSRISLPSRIKEVDTKKMISMINDYVKDICKRKYSQGFYFDIEEKDKIINRKLEKRLLNWKFKSGIKSIRWYKEWRKKLRKN